MRRLFYKLLTNLIFLLIIIILVGCKSNLKTVEEHNTELSNIPTEKSMTPEEQKKFEEYKQKLIEDAANKKQGIVKLSMDGDVFGAINEYAFNDLNQACSVQDEYGISELIKKGVVHIIPKETEAKIIDSKLGMRKVRILNGDLEGKVLWVASEATE